MPIEFECRECGRRLRTPDETAGKQAKCPACGAVQPIPGTVSTDLPQAPRAFPSTSPFAGTPQPPQPAPTGETNPYQAPNAGAGVAWAPPTGVFRPSRFEVGDVLTHAWEIFKVQWGMIVLVVIAATVLSMVIAYTLLGVVALVKTVVNNRVAFFGSQVMENLITQVVGLWLGLGVKLYLMRSARGEDARFSMLFGGGRYFWPALGGMLVLGLASCALAAVCLLPGLLLIAVGGPSSGLGIAGMVIMGLGTLVLVPGVIYMIVVFSQFQYLCIDREAGPIESLTLSMQITQGNRLSIVLVWLLSIAINMLGMLVCCIGVVVTIPLVSLVFVVQYLAMTGQPTVDQYWHAAPAPVDVPPTVPPPEMA